MVEKADGRIEIMPDGGLHSSNIAQLDKKVNASYYHSLAITVSGEIANWNEIAKIKELISFK